MGEWHGGDREVGAQARIHRRQQEERAEKEDSSQEKRASAVLPWTRGVPETPTLSPRSWAREIGRQVAAKFLRCPVCLYFWRSVCLVT